MAQYSIEQQNTTKKLIRMKESFGMSSRLFRMVIGLE